MTYVESADLCPQKKKICFDNDFKLGIKSGNTGLM